MSEHEDKVRQLLAQRRAAAEARHAKFRKMTNAELMAEIKAGRLSLREAPKYRKVEAASESMQSALAASAIAPLFGATKAIAKQHPYLLCLAPVGLCWETKYPPTIPQIAADVVINLGDCMVMAPEAVGLSLQGAVEAFEALFRGYTIDGIRQIRRACLYTEDLGWIKNRFLFLREREIIAQLWQAHGGPILRDPSAESIMRNWAEKLGCSDVLTSAQTPSEPDGEDMAPDTDETYTPSGPGL